MSTELPELSIVVPVYRSADTLPDLVARLRSVLSELNVNWEIVFVDDNSPDDSWRVLRELQEAHPRHLVLVQLMRNFGQHNALMCGFHQASGRWIVTIDDDLQNPPEEIPRLWTAACDHGYDLVYGVFANAKQHSLSRNLASSLVAWFTDLIFRTGVRPTSFRMVRSEVVRQILSYNLNFTYIDGLLCWCTQRIGSVAVAHAPRSSGASGYSWRKLLTLSLNLFTNFSLLPLQFVSLLGFAFSVIGLALGGYYLIQYMLGNIGQAGYASIIVAIFVMSGVQLLSLGVMGEYLGRMHLNINRKPQYVVRTTLGKTTATDSNRS